MKAGDYLKIDKWSVFLFGWCFVFEIIMRRARAFPSEFITTVGLIKLLLS